jgi:hypothetical protein
MADSQPVFQAHSGGWFLSRIKMVFLSKGAASSGSEGSIATATGRLFGHLEEQDLSHERAAVLSS